jgi:hypothetical protein
MSCFIGPEHLSITSATTQPHWSATSITPASVVIAGSSSRDAQAHAEPQTTSGRVLVRSGWLRQPRLNGPRIHTSCVTYWLSRSFKRACCSICPNRESIPYVSRPLAPRQSWTLADWLPVASSGDQRAREGEAEFTAELLNGLRNPKDAVNYSTYDGPSMVIM